MKKITILTVHDLSLKWKIKFNLMFTETPVVVVNFMIDAHVDISVDTLNIF